MVWANPRSLATTWGITFVFFSSGYLDVSVRQVSLHLWIPARQVGCPIRKSWNQYFFAVPPGLSQLDTSFIASESQGIRHAPLITFVTVFIDEKTYNYTSCQRTFLHLLQLWSVGA